MTDMTELRDVAKALFDARERVIAADRDDSDDSADFGDAVVACMRAEKSYTDAIRDPAVILLLLSYVDRLTREKQEAERLLETFVDDEECSLDHHGNCQTHYLGNPCNVAESRALLAARTSTTDLR